MQFSYSFREERNSKDEYHGFPSASRVECQVFRDCFSIYSLPGRAFDVMLKLLVLLLDRYTIWAHISVSIERTYRANRKGFACNKEMTSRSSISVRCFHRKVTSRNQRQFRCNWVRFYKRYSKKKSGSVFCYVIETFSSSQIKLKEKSSIKLFYLKKMMNITGVYYKRVKEDTSYYIATRSSWITKRLVVAERRKRVYNLTIQKI